MNRNARLPLLREIDRIYAALPKVECKGLCTHACGPIMMSEAERDRILRRVGKVPDNGSLQCGLLTDAGRCSVYDIRPIVCRLYGAVTGATSPLVNGRELLACEHGCRVLPGKLTNQEASVMLMAVHSHGGRPVAFSSRAQELFDQVQEASAKARAADDDEPCGSV